MSLEDKLPYDDVSRLGQLHKIMNKFSRNLNKIMHQKFQLIRSIIYYYIEIPIILWGKVSE